MLKVEANPWDVSDPLFQIPLSITCFFCHLPQPTTNDNFGGRNNVITVKKSDFEVFEALDCDANASVCSGSMSEYSTLWIYINAVYHKLQDLLSAGLLFHRGFHIYDTDDLRSSCVDLCWVAKRWKSWVNSCVNLSSIKVNKSPCKLLQVDAGPRKQVAKVKTCIDLQVCLARFCFTVSLSVQSYFLTNQLNCFHFEQNRFQGLHQAHMGNWYPHTTPQWWYTMVCMLVSPLSYLHICFM